MNSEDNICWFHGKLVRDKAENLLRTEGEDGSFLVRESSSSSGDYVLSVRNKEEVIHYQIRKHGEDAFFSIDNEKTIHGLDTLIEYYQDNSHGSDVKLKKPLRGLPPPHETRRHGRTNLLHRATEQKSFTVVSELLKSSSKHNLDAKNQLGQTAVHLAAMTGADEILKTLLEHNASVFCRDTAGYTPLHYACQSNLPNTVKILIDGGANVQARHTETGKVPLHEAASKGHIDVVRILLTMNAPINPRTVMDDTPADLAKCYGHTECEQLLRNYRYRPTSENRSNWYHGTLHRNEAIALLHESGSIDGSFLVRFSNRHNGIYVLTLMYHKQAFHFQIQRKDEYLYIDDGPYLPSLEHLIEHYRAMPDGLPGQLLHPIAPKPRPPIPEMPATIFTGNTLKKSPKKHEMSEKFISSGQSDVSNSDNKTYKAQIAYVHDSSDTYSTFIDSTNINSGPSNKPNLHPVNSHLEFIPAENLILGKVLGEGEFGEVYEGVYDSPNGIQEPVAIKTLRESHNDSMKQEFLREARLMMTLKHHCIVKLIGLSEGPPLLMVQELVPLGSMLAYLLEFKDRISPSYELVLWASQIACGMKYLEELRLVHRDLAARNILLASKHQAKISDFGLSRMFGSNDYYRATAGGKWPIKWYAPESYNFGTFSHKSDVWSFGITLWEMFAYGEQPYGDRRGIDVIQLVDQGERLQKPEKCPLDIYQVMMKCWSAEPKDRPSFADLVDIFSNCIEYANVKELVASFNIS